MPPHDQKDEGALLEPAPSPAGPSGEGPLDQEQPLATGVPGNGQAPPRRPSALLIWGGVAVAVLAAAVVVAVLVLSKGGEGPPPRSRGTFGPGHRATFVFPLIRVIPVSVTGHPPAGAANQVSAAVRAQLSAFYDQAVIDPGHWASGPPTSAWEVFAPEIRSKAQGDAEAFTLGEAGANLTNLVVTTSSMTVRVLFDTAGHVVSAQADVQLAGTGSLRGGGAADVSAHGSFFLANVGGTWLVTGFPDAGIDITPAPATPAPGPSASATATGASP